MIQNHAKMAEVAYLRIGDQDMYANARVVFGELIALKVSILAQLLCDPYTVTYQAASLVTVFDLISLTQPFWHKPQPLPNRHAT